MATSSATEILDLVKTCLISDHDVAKIYVQKNTTKEIMSVIGNRYKIMSPPYYFDKLHMDILCKNVKERLMLLKDRESRFYTDAFRLIMAGNTTTCIQFPILLDFIVRIRDLMLLILLVDDANNTKRNPTNNYNPEAVYEIFRQRLSKEELAQIIIELDKPNDCTSATLNALKYFKQYKGMTQQCAVTKIVINGCHGQFRLSDLAISKYCVGKNLTHQQLLDLSFGIIERNDPLLVSIVEELGEKVNVKPHSELKVVEIPNDVKWTIEEYNGKEWVAECHRTWD